MTDMRETIMAWPLAHAAQGVTLAGGATVDMIEYRRADLPPTLAQALKVPEVAAMAQAAKYLVPYLAWIMGPEGEGRHPTIPSAVRRLTGALAAIEAAMTEGEE